MSDEMPKTIFLLHGIGEEGSTVWCDHVPNEEVEFTKYTRAQPEPIEGGEKALAGMRKALKTFGEFKDGETVMLMAQKYLELTKTN